MCVHRPMGSGVELVIRDASFLSCIVAMPPGWSLVNLVCFSQLETCNDTGNRSDLKALLNIDFVRLWL